MDRRCGGDQDQALSASRRANRNDAGLLLELLLENNFPERSLRECAPAEDRTVATQFWSGGHLVHFCGSLGDSEEGTARLVISAPVITALRIWPNRSVNVFGVCGIKMVLL